MLNKLAGQARLLLILRGGMWGCGVVSLGFCLWGWSLEGGTIPSRFVQVSMFACMAVAVMGCLPPRWLIRCSALCMSLILGLLGAEIGLRQLYADRLVSLYDWDDQLHYRPAPDTQRVFQRLPINGGQRITTRFNRQGYRGEELSSEYRLPRIAVYGDSFIQAEYSAESETFVKQLGAAWRQSTGQAVEMVNAGVVGYGPDQALLKLRAELPSLQPDFVIFTCFADNDLGDLLRNKLLSVKDGQLVMLHPQRASTCRHPGLGESRQPLIWQMARQVVRGIQATAGSTPSLMEQWLAQCQMEYQEVRSGDELVRQLQYDHYDADVSLQPGSDSARYKQELLRAVLNEVKVTLDQTGIPGLVLIVPSPADLIPGYDFCAIDPRRYPEYQPQHLVRIFEKACQQAGLPVCSLFETFAEHQPHTLYFKGGDNHWNDAGQKLAAQTVAKQLQSQGTRWVVLPRNGPSHPADISTIAHRD